MGMSVNKLLKTGGDLDGLGAHFSLARSLMARGGRNARWDSIGKKSFSKVAKSIPDETRHNQTPEELEVWQQALWLFGDPGKMWNRFVLSAFPATQCVQLIGGGLKCVNSVASTG